MARFQLEVLITGPIRQKRTITSVRSQSPDRLKNRSLEDGRHLAMDLQLLGKVALITGGSRGIGRSIALGLAAEGCAIAVAARGTDSLLEIERELISMQAPVMTSVVDVTSSVDLQRFVQETAERFGRIDVVVANAGG